jgi:integration host factor subunit alpha
MSFSKKDIAKNISSNINVSEAESKLLVDSFINIIKTKSKKLSLKIASFGTFSIKKTPERIGRNPKTKQEFIISERSKLKFSPSHKLRNLIN